MHLSWVYGVAAMMEHPQVPVWSSATNSAECDGASLNDVVSSFCTRELRYFSELPHVKASHIHQCSLGQI
eukprot:12417602-Karenia_brevis.AAC.1